MIERLVAFSGSVEVLDANWSLSGGRQVTFRICGEPFDRIHPFKKYQQRRNGRVGTRFQASFARTTTGEPLNSFSVMLCAWKDSSTAGQQVTFWIDDEPEMHPFCGCQRRQNGTPGDIFALVLVELADDETPIDQSVRARVEGSQGPGGSDPQGTEAQGTGEDPVQPHGRARHGGNQSKPRKPRSLSSTVHLLVTGAIFVRFLEETKPNLVPHWDSQKAREYVKSYLKVQSLSELDNDPEKARRWQKVRSAFERWNHQEPLP